MLRERFDPAVFDTPEMRFNILEQIVNQKLLNQLSQKQNIVVSDEVGWRKPRRDIFDAALDRLGVRAEESLFVGDRADMDVLGAQQIGMDAAWINRDGEKLPPGVAPPTYEIRDLGELAGILGVGSSI